MPDYVTIWSGFVNIPGPEKINVDLGDALFYKHAHCEIFIPPLPPWCFFCLNKTMRYVRLFIGIFIPLFFILVGHARASSLSLAEEYRQKGQALYKAGKYQQALLAFEKYADFMPGHWRPHNRLGWTSIKLLDYSSAIQHLKKANTIHEHPGNHEGLGEIFYIRKDYPNAWKHFSRYARLAPNDWYAENRLGWACFGLGNFPDATSHFTRANSLKPSRGSYTGLGQAFNALEEFESALHAFQALIKLDPEGWYARNRLGWVYFSMGRYDWSVEAFKKANELEWTWGSYEGLARAYLALGQYGKAISLARAGIERDPNVKKVHNWSHILAYCHAGTGNIQGAVNILGRDKELGMEGRRSPQGFLVLHVYKGGPADRSGLAQGDILHKINEWSLENQRFRDLMQMVRMEADWGEEVRVRVLRHGRARMIRLTVGILPEPETPDRPFQPSGHGMPFGDGKGQFPDLHQSP